MGLEFFRAPKKPEGHPLLGQMYKTAFSDICAMLARRPPTPEESDELAVEELAGWDRAAVFTLLDSYRTKEKWPEE